MSRPQAIQPRTWTKLDGAQGWVMHRDWRMCVVVVDHLGRVHFDDTARGGWTYSLGDPLDPVVTALEPKVEMRTDGASAHSA